MQLLPVLGKNLLPYIHVTFCRALGEHAVAYRANLRPPRTVSIYTSIFVVPAIAPLILLPGDAHKVWLYN